MLPPPSTPQAAFHAVEPPHPWMSLCEMSRLLEVLAMPGLTPAVLPQMMTFVSVTFDMYRLTSAPPLF